MLDEFWGSDRIQAGLSSGEGLIWAVRDPLIKQEPIKSRGRVVDYQDVQIDEGISDKRLLLQEGEFASTLRVLGRDGNTLSAVIRNAWDTGKLHILTKSSPGCATDAHISIIAHITRDELLRYLDSTETGNGFGNRFLWICVKRSKTLPEGGNLTDVKLEPLIRRLSLALEFASRSASQMQRDQNARIIWNSVYPALSEGKPGLVGAMTARAEAQVMRLACIYALLDCSDVVRREHLDAALAVWRYAEASARFIFGESLGDPVADELLRVLKQSSDGLTRTDISSHFGRNKGAKEIGRALVTLQESGLARSEMENTDGRPAERWFALYTANSTENEKSK